MINSDFAFFKVPTEILLSLSTSSSKVYPANYYQFKLYNFRIERVQLDNKLLELQEILRLAEKQHKRFAEYWPLTRNWNDKKELAKLSYIYHWGRECKQQNLMVIAWNENDPQTMALALSGAKITYIENGFFRRNYLYCSDPETFANQELILTKRNQRIVNLKDILVNLFEPTRTSYYYVQILYNSLNKLRLLEKSVSNAGCKSQKILFLSQLDFDGNTVCRGNGLTSSSVIDVLHRVNNKLVRVRRHPNSKPTWKSLFMNNFSLKEDLCWADVVVTINSSAIIEGLLLNKRCYLLGDGDLAHIFPEICRKVTDSFYAEKEYPLSIEEIMKRLADFKSAKHVRKL